MVVIMGMLVVMQRMIMAMLVMIMRCMFVFTLYVFVVVMFMFSRKSFARTLIIEGFLRIHIVPPIIPPLQFLVVLASLPIDRAHLPLPAQCVRLLP